MVPAAAPPFVRHQLFISERPSLPVILPIREARNLAAFLPDAEFLDLVGVSAPDIAARHCAAARRAADPIRLPRGIRLRADARDDFIHRVVHKLPAQVRQLVPI